jgi:Tfp pilus assembly protein PilE
VILVVLGMLAVLACAGYIGYLVRENEKNKGNALGGSAVHSEQVTLSAGGWLNGADHVSMDQMTEGRRTR